MTNERKPHPQNVAGDFYVQDECCTLCDIPRTEAPELFALTENEDHCFVSRQPQTEDEISQMLSAIACAELKCIHYRGRDPAIISRLSAMGEMDVCDSTPLPGIELGLRNHVTFATPHSNDLSNLGSSFKAFVKNQNGEYSRVSFPLFSGNTTTIKYKRNDEGWHSVRFGHHKDFVHVWHDSGDASSVSSYINHWISTLENVSNIRWYTDNAWHSTGVWHRSHW